MLHLLLIPVLMLSSFPVPRSAEPSLCAPQDEQTAKDLAKALKKEKALGAKAELVKALAKRAASTPDEAEDAWDSIADCVQNDSFQVRLEALRLMKDSPDRDAAVKSLTKALDKSLLEAAKSGAGSGAAAPRGRAGGNPLKGVFGPKGDDKKDAPKPKEDPDKEKAEEERAEASARDLYFEEIIAVVGQLPDDRSAKAMIQYFEKTQGRGLGVLQLKAAQALAQLGTRSALESVRRVLERTAELAEGEKAMEERARQRGEAAGGGRNSGPSAQESAAGLHAALVSAAERAKLADFPAYDDKVARNWKKFLSEHSDAFPSKLGKITDAEGA